MRTEQVIEASLPAVLDELSRRFIERCAQDHRKVCDECWGYGYKGISLLHPERSCAWECRQCGGTGWMRCA